MDGSTDKGRVENELFVILFCKIDDTLQEIRTYARYLYVCILIFINFCARYLCVLEPTKADADGLLQCLCKALGSMGIENLLD